LFTDAHKLQLGSDLPNVFGTHSCWQGAVAVGRRTGALAVARCRGRAVTVRAASRCFSERDGV
jgi:hypothetical protein